MPGYGARAVQAVVAFGRRIGHAIMNFMGFSKPKPIAAPRPVYKEDTSSFYGSPPRKSMINTSAMTAELGKQMISKVPMTEGSPVMTIRARDLTPGKGAARNVQIRQPNFPRVEVTSLPTRFTPAEQFFGSFTSIGGGNFMT